MRICGIERKRNQNPASFCSDGNGGLALSAVSIDLAEQQLFFKIKKCVPNTIKD